MFPTVLLRVVHPSEWGAFLVNQTPHYKYLSTAEREGLLGGARPLAQVSISAQPGSFGFDPQIFRISTVIYILYRHII